MTNREFYLAIANSELNEELITKANELIATLDHKNELRKSSESKEKKEVMARKNSIIEFFKANPIVSLNREQIAENLNMTLGQATSACTALVKDGFLSKTEVKVDKSRKMVYSLSIDVDHEKYGIED